MKKKVLVTNIFQISLAMFSALTVQAQNICIQPTGVGVSHTDVCIGNSINLNATIPSGINTVNWYTTPTSGTPIATTTNNTTSYTPPITGTFTYYAEGINFSGAGGTQNFTYTGSVQSVTLLPGIYLIQSWGADGYTQDVGFNGRGGYATGSLTVTSAQTFYIYVGGAGTYPASGVTANT